jgi:hypothetical protein
MSSYKLTRRNFLTSSGAVFVLPLLQSMFPRNAEAAADPRRWICYYFCNGTYNQPDKPIWYTNQGALSASNTSIALSPYSTMYGQMTHLNGMKMDNYYTAFAQFQDDHQSGCSTWMTFDGTIKSTTNSFDYMIGNAVGKAPLVLSGGTTNADYPADPYLSYSNGKGQLGTYNPGDLYRSLLTAVVPTVHNSAVTTSTSSTKSILDSALADFNSFTGKLGSADQAKMDEFMTSLRSLETQLVGASSPSPSASVSPNPSASATGGNLACVTPTLASNMDSSNSQDTTNYLAKMYAMNDLIKIAFACDITRSVSVMCDTETSSRTFVSPTSSLIYQGGDIGGGYESHIAISHASGQSTAGYNLCATRDRVMLGVPLDLATKLMASNDPSGSTMLSNTIIQCGMGVQDGDHQVNQDRRPLLLIGGTNGLTIGGQSWDYTNNQYADMYYTIVQWLGLNINVGSTTTIKL